LSKPVAVPAQWQEGLRCAFLMESTCGRLLVLGRNPLHGSDVLGSRMGASLWDLSLGQHTGDGKLDGETFLCRTWMFFLGGAGEGKRNSRARLPRRFRRTTRVPNNPDVIYYILRSGFFHYNMSSGHRKGGSRSSIALDRHVCCST
jgi:hypothetical protein